LSMPSKSRDCSACDTASSKLSSTGRSLDTSACEAEAARAVC
jgi:hypothetical protein